MRLISLKCPHCGSNLEIENGIDVFFCKYCGGKIMMDGMSKDAYKVRIRVKEMDHEERLKDKDIDLEKYRMKLKDQSDRQDMKLLVFMFAIGCLMMLSGAILSMLK